MTINLTCTQVSALLSFYLDDRLNQQLKQFVKAHLDICPACRAKFETLKKMVESLKEVHEKVATVDAPEREASDSPQYNEFKANLSAYIDNELSDEENIKIKKYVISNPRARQEIENLYEFEKTLHNSFERIKNSTKTDFSKQILKRIDIQEEINTPNSFAKIIAIFIILFAVCTLGMLFIYWI